MDHSVEACEVFFRNQPNILADRLGRLRDASIQAAIAIKTRIQADHVVSMVGEGRSQQRTDITIRSCYKNVHATVTLSSCGNSCSICSTTAWPISSEAVAAGDGALHICSERGP